MSILKMCFKIWFATSSFRSQIFEWSRVNVLLQERGGQSQSLILLSSFQFTRSLLLQQIRCSVFAAAITKRTAITLQNCSCVFYNVFVSTCSYCLTHPLRSMQFDTYRFILTTGCSVVCRYIDMDILF